MTSEVPEPASMVEAAQQALADGKYAAAEQMLRAAAARQEAELGAKHPDLATTLNNLAFVCERLEKFDEAERGYRRAHAIAVASLSPGHPLIKTSLANLLEFCAAHDVPVWTPKAKSVAAKASAKPVDEDIDDDFDEEPEPLPSTVAPELAQTPVAVPAPVVLNSRPRPRTVLVAALGVAATVVVMFAIQGQGTTESDLPARLSSASTPTVSVSPAVPPTPPPAERIASRETTPTVPPKTRQADPPTSEVPTSEGPVTVLTARLCSALEKTGSPDWQCVAVNGEARPGRYMFYTRLRAAAGTTVEHRWYAGERLYQSTKLRMPASAGNGYRTFSSSRVTPERAGDWKVELRAADGTLLDEARFVVR